MSKDAKSKTSDNASAGQLRSIDRRNLLLGSSTLVAAAALTSEALAQVQKPAPAATPAGTNGRKPNILFIILDDVGIDVVADKHGLPVLPSERQVLNVGGVQDVREAVEGHVVQQNVLIGVPHDKGAHRPSPEACPSAALRMASR